MIGWYLDVDALIEEALGPARGFPLKPERSVFLGGLGFRV